MNKISLVAFLSLTLTQSTFTTPKFFTLKQTAAYLSTLRTTTKKRAHTKKIVATIATTAGAVTLVTYGICQLTDLVSQ